MDIYFDDIDENSIIEEINLNKTALICELNRLILLPVPIKSQFHLHNLSKGRKDILINWFKQFYVFKDKTIPLMNYFVPVHEQETSLIHHGVYNDVPRNYSFINAVIQLLVSIEKKRKFPLTLPTHLYRFVFDDYGKFCSLKTISDNFHFLMNDDEDKKWVLKFLEYIFSYVPIPIGMLFLLNDSTASASKGTSLLQYNMDQFYFKVYVG
jgi:hypothetical protein